MKKSKLGILALAGVLALSGCSCNNKGLTGNAKIIDEAKDYTVEQLVELAKKETGKFTVYSTSSKTEKAVKAFCTKYELGDICEYTKKSESEYYTTVEQLFDAGSAEIDFLVTQNGASLSVEQDAGNVINYNPVVEGATKSDMYAFMYYVKEFAAAKTFTDLNITNVWQLTETEANIDYKKSGEPINYLFLAELTTETWSNKLAAAYKSWKNVGDTELNAALTAGNYANAGYMFIDKFLPKVTNVKSEGDAAKANAIATTPNIAFSPVSKYSTGTEGTYDKVKFFNNMEGFNGYAYKFYAQISKTTDRPYTAMLFTNYLSTAEGIAHYQEGNGVYSSNTKVQTDLNTLLDGFVIENYSDVKASWASIVKKLESYAA